MVERLSESCRTGPGHRRHIRAYDLLERNVAASWDLVKKILVGDGRTSATVRLLANTWVRPEDYLLVE